MGLTHSIYTSFDQVPTQEWDRLTADDPDLTMDRRLIGAYEATMGGQCQSFTVVIRDASNSPVALGSCCLFRMKTGPIKIGVLFCGLPIPAGQNHLRILPGADRTAVLVQLDLSMREIAKKHGAMIVVIKEFNSTECDGLKTLSDRGYLLGEIPARHLLFGEFRSFDGYRNAIKARYRSQVNRSFKKFKKAALRVEQVRGPEDLARVYTDEVHQLYEAVQAKSKYRLEKYPAEFMRELGRRFGDDASLTCLYQGEKLVGFTIGIVRNAIYHNLYSGLDYSLNNEADLYFNLFYHDLDFAWKRGAKEVHLGQTSDDFKSRLGSKAEQMYLYIRPPNPLIRWGLKTFSKWALPKLKPVEAYDVFKSSGADESEEEVSKSA